MVRGHDQTGIPQAENRKGNQAEKDAQRGPPAPQTLDPSFSIKTCRQGPNEAIYDSVRVVFRPGTANEGSFPGIARSVGSMSRLCGKGRLDC